MPDASARELRKRFNTEAARAAFDRINSMCPKWTIIEGALSDSSKNLYISPNIGSKVVNGGLLSSVGNGWGDNADDIIFALERALKNTGAHPNTLLVVNPHSEDRREYTYDAQRDEYCLYSGKIYSDKPFSIKLKKPGA